MISLPCRELQYGPNVVWLKVRIILKNLVLGKPGSQHIENVFHAKYACHECRDVRRTERD